MDCVDFDRLEEIARQAYAEGVNEYVAAGADDGFSLIDNRAAWRRWVLRPRMLRDLSRLSTETTLLGQKVATPIMVAPMGRHAWLHPEGEAATARGAAEAGSVFNVATFATVSLEDVARASGEARRWFQLYLQPDRAVSEDLIDRAAAAGYGAIVVTVDQPVMGWSPAGGRIQVAPSERYRHANLPGAPIIRSGYINWQNAKLIYPATFADLEWLVRRTKLPVVVKGIVRADDAARCIDCGAKAVVVSNHGARHLDTCIAPADALADIVAAVGAQAEIYVDGGIRRGTDILKAIAIGARAVLVGRPVLWGLATGGASGVFDVLEHLRTELIRAMALAGAPRLEDAGPDLVQRVGA